MTIIDNAILKLIELYEQRGAFFAAAKIVEKSGDTARAVALYEQAGMNRKAEDLARKAGIVKSHSSEELMEIQKGMFYDTAHMFRDNRDGNPYYGNSILRTAVKQLLPLGLYEEAWAMLLQGRNIQQSFLVMEHSPVVPNDNPLRFYKRNAEDPQPPKPLHEILRSTSINRYASLWVKTVLQCFEQVSWAQNRSHGCIPMTISAEERHALRETVRHDYFDKSPEATHNHLLLLGRKAGYAQHEAETLKKTYDLLEKRCRLPDEISDADIYESHGMNGFAGLVLHKFVVGEDGSINKSIAERAARLYRSLDKTDDGLSWEAACLAELVGDQERVNAHLKNLETKLRSTRDVSHLEIAAKIARRRGDKVEEMSHWTQYFSARANWDLKASAYHARLVLEEGRLLDQNEQYMGWDRMRFVPSVLLELYQSAGMLREEADFRRVLWKAYGAYAEARRTPTPTTAEYLLELYIDNFKARLYRDLNTSFENVRAFRPTYEVALANTPSRPQFIDDDTVQTNISNDPRFVLPEDMYRTESAIFDLVKARRVGREYNKIEAADVAIKSVLGEFFPDRKEEFFGFVVARETEIAAAQK